MEWSFTTTGPVDARVDLPTGQIDVESAAQDEVHVSLEPRKPGSRRALEMIEASTVTFESGRLRVHVPSRPFKNADLYCTIVFPEGSSLEVKTASADVRCSGRIGSFSGSVASADVILGEVDGDVVLATASGDFRCESISEGLSVKGASADITVGKVAGPVDIGLASGDIHLEGADSSVKVHTASGDLHVGRASHGDINASTVSGDLRIGVAAGTSAFLDLSSLSGEMTCTLPIQEGSPAEAMLRITCHTMSGDVRIESAPV